MNSEIKTKSFHLIGDHLRFSSVTFAMKRVNYLNGYDGHLAESYFLQINKNASEIKKNFLRLKHFIILRKIILKKVKNGTNLIHLYSLIDFILLVIFIKVPRETAICLSIYDLKINQMMNILLNWLIKRVDHFFVSSRFVTDQFWSLLNIPPSRSTVLALTKYLERRDISLIALEKNAQERKTISIGCFLADSSEIGKLARFNALVRASLQNSDVKIQFYLIKNNINYNYVPENSESGCVQTVNVVDDLDALKLDFWLVFSSQFSCPYINDALKIGARVIAPSTHYTSELQRILKSRLLTYKANEVSSAVKIMLSMIDGVISGTYIPYGLTSSSWQTERRYLLESYQKAVRRRLFITRIT